MSCLIVWRSRYISTTRLASDFFPYTLVPLQGTKINKVNPSCLVDVFSKTTRWPLLWWQRKFTAYWSHWPMLCKTSCDMVGDDDHDSVHTSLYRDYSPFYPTLPSLILWIPALSAIYTRLVFCLPSSPYSVLPPIGTKDWHISTPCLVDVISRTNEEGLPWSTRRAQGRRMLETSRFGIRWIGELGMMISTYHSMARLLCAANDSELQMVWIFVPISIWASTDQSRYSPCSVFP